MAVVSLRKDERVSLTKTAETPLMTIGIGLGWKPRASAGEKFDLDAIAFALDANNKAIMTDTFNGFVFYHAKDSGNGEILHSGDNRTGDGDGDDEIINIDLTKIPANVAKIDIGVSIDEAKTRNQFFSMVDDAYIRITNGQLTTTSAPVELARYDLSEDGGRNIGMVVGSIYRTSDGSWSFKALQDAYEHGLPQICTHYGIETA